MRERLTRFNAEGLDGLGDRPVPGRPRRLTEAERSQIIALARSVPLGRPQCTDGGDLRAAEEAGPAQWTLDSLVEAAQRRHELTFCAASRNSDGWIQLLARIAKANPRGPIRMVADKLSSHTSVKVRRWLARHRRIQQVFIPKAACWLNLAEGWWRLLRRAAFARQAFADATEIAYAVQTATAQLNAHPTPWIWGRPPPPTRKLRRMFTYCL